MPRQFQFSLATALLLLTCCALILALLCSATWWTVKLVSLRSKNDDLQTELDLLKELSHIPTDYAIRNSSITIAMSVATVEWSQEIRWSLSINSRGQANLTIGPSGEPDETYEFSVSQEQFDQLREALIQERFFELASGQGYRGLHDISETITIVIGQGQFGGDYAKTVRVNSLRNWLVDDQEKLREPARALRVLLLIRSWFNHPRATDPQDFYQQVIAAAAKLDKSPVKAPPRAP